MADQIPHHGGRRPHFHRGRRGPDRRGSERRTSHGPEPANREQVDVEQIMRDIRARIAQRHGIELSNQQVHELAARRLEAILEPRNLSPSLLEQLRKSAGDTTEVSPPPAEPSYVFDETTLYHSHRGLLRFIRRLLNPILKLFFNPTPVADALRTQARLNAEAAAREADRDRRQAEWNALHFELVQRMATEVSRISIDMQALATRVESLAAKVDFNDRRVRSMENPQQARPHGRPTETPATAGTIAPEPPSPESAVNEGSADGPRRRRRRRRGRRGGAGAPESVGASEGAVATSDVDDSDLSDVSEAADEDGAESAAADDHNAVALEPAHAISPLQPLEPHPSAPVETMQPEPPRDEPTPSAPVDHADSGPPDR
jgi:hypothetical protein